LDLDAIWVGEWDQGISQRMGVWRSIEGEVAVYGVNVGHPIVTNGDLCPRGGFGGFSGSVV